MELSPGWVSAGVAVVGFAGTSIAAWLRSVDAAQEARITEVKGTQKTLFEKHDRVAAELQVYKLHVAETYVNREVLREQLAPINKALEKIDSDLREMRKP